MKFKLTKEEKSWVLYDVGNSAFVLLIATIIPIYFNYLAGKAGLSNVEYLAYWGYVASIVTLIIVLAGPICGALADTKGYKKPIFMISLIIGVAGCIGLGFVKNWLLFLVVFVIAKVGYSSSLIFYDSMLSDVTQDDRMDDVSAQGYAWGYIGSCVPFVLCLVIVLGSDPLGIRMETAMGIAFVLVAVWWLLMSLPLLKNYEQKSFLNTRLARRMLCICSRHVQPCFSRLHLAARGQESLNRRLDIHLLCRRLSRALRRTRPSACCRPQARHHARHTRLGRRHLSRTDSRSGPHLLGSRQHERAPAVNHRIDLRRPTRAG